MHKMFKFGDGSSGMTGGRKMERSRLRRYMGTRYAEPDLIIEELEKESQIARLSSPTGKEMICLRSG